MASPQTGIFALGTNSHAYLEFDATGDPTVLVAAEASLREPRTTIGGVNLVTGFRPELWGTSAQMPHRPTPPGWNATSQGPEGYIVRATQHDAVMWLTGAEYDVVFEPSRGLVRALAPTPGRRRDLGLVVPPRPRSDGLHRRHRESDSDRRDAGGGIPDGTARARVARCYYCSSGTTTSPPGTRCRWRRQEQVIGRRKADSVELASDRPPPTSRAGPTRTLFGTIFRRNMPVRHRHRPRDDLRRLLLQPGDPRRRCSAHGRLRRRP